MCVCVCVRACVCSYVRTCVRTCIRLERCEVGTVWIELATVLLINNASLNTLVSRHLPKLDAECH